MISRGELLVTIARGRASSHSVSPDALVDVVWFAESIGTTWLRDRILHQRRPGSRLSAPLRSKASCVRALTVAPSHLENLVLPWRHQSAPLTVLPARAGPEAKKGARALSAAGDTVRSLGLEGARPRGVPLGFDARNGTRRDPRATALYQLLETYYEDVKSVWEERFEKRYGYWRGFLRWAVLRSSPATSHSFGGSPMRTIVDTVVARYLDCGTEEAGFARLRCDTCVLCRRPTPSKPSTSNSRF